MSIEILLGLPSGCIHMTRKNGRKSEGIHSKK